MNGETQPAIVAEGLTRSFPGICAVDALSIEVRAGEIFGLVGPDGAGKTTTLRMLAGILPPDGGSAQVAGFDVVRDPEGVHGLGHRRRRNAVQRGLVEVDLDVVLHPRVFHVPVHIDNPRRGLKDLLDLLAISICCW